MSRSFRFSLWLTAIISIAFVSCGCSVIDNVTGRRQEARQLQSKAEPWTVEITNRATVPVQVVFGPTGQLLGTQKNGEVASYNIPGNFVLAELVFVPTPLPGTVGLESKRQTFERKEGASAAPSFVLNNDFFGSKH